MKTSLVIIHGGTTFDTYEEYIRDLESSTLTLEKINRKDWKDGLKEELLDYEVIYPKMPNSKNARYLEWKIWFEKLFPLLSEQVVLIGHSLGGIFLAKYLCENIFPKKIKQIHLIAAPYDTEIIKESLADFALDTTVEKLSNISEHIYLYQSQDDQAVAYEDVLKYKRDIPTAELVVFENRGHFTGEEFPELIENIRLVK